MSLPPNQHKGWVAALTPSSGARGTICLALLYNTTTTCVSSQEAQPPLKHVLSLPLCRLCTSSAGPHNTTAASAFTLHALARQTNQLCEYVTRGRDRHHTVQNLADRRQHEPRFVDLPPKPHGAAVMQTTQTKALSTGTKKHPHWHASTTKSHCSTAHCHSKHSTPLQVNPPPRTLCCEASSLLDSHPYTPHPH
jgi:hypothetical protein